MGGHYGNQGRNVRYIAVKEVWKSNESQNSSYYLKLYKGVWIHTHIYIYNLIVT